MAVNVAILAAVVLTALALWSPWALRRRTWRAMATPLASIIGSGFLVLGPILDAAYGAYAPLTMAGLCAVAYLFGGAIRFNILALKAGAGARGPAERAMETAASWLLAFAYVVSVAYYLNLFGAFGVSLTGVDDRRHAQLLTTAVFLVILFVGWTRGFKMLEHLEYGSVTLKLAIIVGLLLGLAVYLTDRAAAGALVVNPPERHGWDALALGFGLIITVQGFETSRYLGAAYDAETRRRSMRWAQWLTTLIYMAYILLFAYLFERGQIRLHETAIIDMMRAAAPILPGLLVAAALAAQFSAAVADTSGSGGLFQELTNGRVTPRKAYALLAAIGLALTWSAGVFEIINYASRAFAGYYALQSALAALTARRTGAPAWRVALYAALAVLGAAIVVFGEAVET